MLRFSRSLILHYLEDIKTQHLFIHYLVFSTSQSCLFPSTGAFLPLGLSLYEVGTCLPLLPCLFLLSFGFKFQFILRYNHWNRNLRNKEKKGKIGTADDGSWREPAVRHLWDVMICGSQRITGSWILWAPMKGIWWHLHVWSSIITGGTVLSN